ncbi:unnamed protein product [Sphagnum balticum]
MRKFEKNEGGMFQQDYVSYFVETIEQSWMLNNTAIIANFLRIGDAGEYAKYKKDYNVEESRLPIAKLKTTKGRVRLAIEPKMPKLYTQFRQTFTITEQKLNK